MLTSESKPNPFGKIINKNVQYWELNTSTVYGVMYLFVIKLTVSNVKSKTGLVFYV